MAFEEQRAQYLRAMFDAIPLPGFIVDSDARIDDFNTAAEEFLGPEASAALHERAGEAFRCIHSEAAGCGKSAVCAACIIRRAVTEATQGKGTQREWHKAELRLSNGRVSAVELLISAQLLPYTETPKAMLILENLTQLRVLQRRKPLTGETNAKHARAGH